MSVDRVRTILINAKALIASPYHWTKGTDARDGSGVPVTASSKRAFAFCGLGALQRVADNYPLASSAARTFYQANGQILHVFNDRSNTTHEDILKAFDKAIEYAETS